MKYLNTMKRVLSLLLALCLVLGYVPYHAHAEADTVCGESGHNFGSDSLCTVCGMAGGRCGENVTWLLDLESGLFTLSGEGAMYDYIAVDDSPWYKEAYSDQITSLEIGENITHLGACAFFQCENLKSVTIPAGVTSMGNHVFAETGLESVTFEGNALTKIPNSAFHYASKLKSITLPEGITTIGEGAFSFCFDLKKTVIPASVTEIQAMAFERAGLENWEIHITGNAPTLGNDVFASASWRGFTVYIYGKDVDTTTYTSQYQWQKNLYFVNQINARNLSVESVAKDHNGVAMVLLDENGKAEPTVVVADYTGQKRLEEGVDYQVSYENNTALGTATAVVTGIGEYGGRATVDFFVVDGGSCGDNAQYYLYPDGDEAFTLYIIGNGEMYDYSQENPAPWADRQICEAVVTGVSSVGSYAFANLEAMEWLGLGDSVVTIGEGALDGCSNLFEIDIDGAAPTAPEGLFADTVSMVGILAMGLDAYGYEETPWDQYPVIYMNRILDSEVTLSQKYYPYTGQAIEPAVTVEKPLEGAISESNYTVSYSDNTEKGTATVTVTGQDDFEGSVATATFEIVDGQCGNLFWNFDETTGQLDILGEGELTELPEIAAEATAICIPEEITAIADNTFDGCDSLENVYVPCAWDENPLYSFGEDVTVNMTTHAFGEDIVCDVCDMVCGHDYSAENDYVCQKGCGCVAVAMLTTKTETQYFESLGSAIVAARSMKQKDEAVLKLLRDIQWTDDEWEAVVGGVFTLDLNGKTLSYEGYMLDFRYATVVIIDTGDTPGAVLNLSPGSSAVCTWEPSDVTITGGRYGGEGGAVFHNYGNMTITGGTFEADVDTAVDATLTVSGGTFAADFYVMGDVTITGSPQFLEKKIYFQSGSLDLSGMTDPEGLRISSYWEEPATVVLPEGYYLWYKGEKVTQLVPGETALISAKNITPLTVDGVMVTEENAEDILGDGTMSYDPETATLTMNNVTLNCESEEYAISHSGSLNVNLVGQNVICGENDGFYIGCTRSGVADVTFSGTGSLMLDVASEGIRLEGDGISLTLEDSVSITMGSEEKPMEEEGIYLFADQTAAVTITDHANLWIITNDEEGIYVGSDDTNQLTISGNATVYAFADEEALTADTIVISGGNVTAIGGEGYEGIDTCSLTISGGNVYAAGDYVGIYAEEMAITGGTVTVENGIIASKYIYDEDDNFTGAEVGHISLSNVSVVTPQNGKLAPVTLLYEEIPYDVLAVVDAEGNLATHVVLCDHAATQHTTATANDDGETHTYICTLCAGAVSEEHDYDSQTHLCICQTAKSFTATFDANGGRWQNYDTVKTVEVPYGSPIPAPEDPIQHKHEFVGWTPAVGVMDAEGKTFTAQWEPVKFTLSFYTDEDATAPVATFQVPYNTKLVWWQEGEYEYTAVPTEYLQNLLDQIDVSKLEKAHYTFDGWNWEGVLDSMLEDIDVYARYTPHLYSISWDFAGGQLVNCDRVPDKGFYNERFYLPYWDADIPLVKEGYRFSHFTDQNGNRYDPFVGGYSDVQYWYVGKMPGYDLQLTAVWECLHQTTQAVDHSDGTHNLVCVDLGCDGYVVTSGVSHSELRYVSSGSTITALCGQCNGVAGKVAVKAENKTYSGNAAEATLEKAGVFEGMEIALTYAAGDAALSGAPVNAGSYTATVRLPNPGDNNDSISAGVSFTIEKAAPAVTAPTAISISYTGQAQNLVSAGAATGGTVYYSLDGTTWSTAIPAGTNAGSYTVYYKVAGDINHTDTQAATLNVLLEQAKLDSATVTANGAFIYNGTQHAPTDITVKLGQTILVKDVDYTVSFSGNVNPGNATVTVTGKGNYKGMASGSFTIVPCPHEDNIPATCVSQQVCKNCGAEHGQLGQHEYGQLIPAQAEVHTHDRLKPAVAAHYFCDVCDSYFDANKAATTLEGLTGQLPVHTPGAAVQENRVESTCVNAGSYQEVVYCSVCGTYEISRQTKELPLNPNAHGDNRSVVGDVAATCDRNGYTGDTVCACGVKVANGQVIPATGHSYDNQWDTSCNGCGAVRVIQSTPMYRLYNSNSGEHFYTGSTQERDTLVRLGWTYEGIAWNAPITMGDPVYRLYNPNTGDHHYTMDATERDNVAAAGWIYEGVAWNSASASGVPIYRMYNPNAVSGIHHYTGSMEEVKMLESYGWIYEGIGWYSL